MDEPSEASDVKTRREGEERRGEERREVLKHEDHGKGSWKECIWMQDTIMIPETAVC